MPTFYRVIGEFEALVQHDTHSQAKSEGFLLNDFQSAFIKHNQTLPVLPLELPSGTNFQTAGGIPGRLRL